MAVIGLGGFHLACDATNTQAVSELRQRKLRVDKPFALMMPNLAMIEEHCYVSEAERELLTSVARPIVLLQRKPNSNIAKEVAPGQDTNCLTRLLHWQAFGKESITRDRQRLSLKHWRIKLRRRATRFRWSWLKLELELPSSL